MTSKMIRRLRQTLPGVTAPPLRDENLVICLASFFEPWVESEELDDSGTWKQEAIEHADAVLDAIAEHYSPEIARLESRIAALEAELAGEDLPDLKPSDFGLGQLVPDARTTGPTFGGFDRTTPPYWRDKEEK